ncbi:hypothetical protein DFW37_17590 [Clostridioides difficile]|nr:hypothetical protein [Clostridioides difficile]EGT4669010.1 hypothetical protein [Clostridioides difficile]
MENLMMSVIASYIYDKLKNHSNATMNYTPLRRQLKHVKLSPKRGIVQNRIDFNIVKYRNYMTY